ncbi:MAG: hypothetical protein KKB85_01515, partial [Candidatus Altiarchaeota archaeon]|nr:hypothetical protein [Candidatus Altiarchaeota archaeon]
RIIHNPRLFCIIIVLQAVPAGRAFLFQWLIAEDRFNVVVKNKNPRFVHVPFTLDEIIRK